MREQKDLRLFIKAAVDEQGVFEGLASTYGNIDLQGDVILPGAFSKSLGDRGGEIPILWQHNSAEPIGIGTLTDSAEGLRIRGELVLESNVAKAAYKFLKRGVIKGLSVGIDVLKYEIKNGIRYLTELKLFEVSLVTSPANELAQVATVKAEPDYTAIANELRSVFAAARLK
jgi:uncharacterized protein